MSLTLESIVVQDPDLVQTDLDDYTVLMSIEAGKFFSINPLGTRIWGILERPARLHDVCSTLVEEYEVSPGACQEEVLAFVGALVEQRLVRLQN